LRLHVAKKLSEDTMQFFEELLLLNNQTLGDTNMRCIETQFSNCALILI